MELLIVWEQQTPWYTLLKKVNANPCDPSILKEFLKWNKAGGKVLRGLTNRRIDEANYYFGDTID